MAYCHTSGYTPLPYIFCDTVKDMKFSELKVTLVAFRKILGENKTEPVPISYSEFQRMSGMSRKAVAAGVKEALIRGGLILAGKNDNGIHLYTLSAAYRAGA